jgi:hypothetical protein
MSHVTIVNRSQLFATATAISAVGFLTIPTPAQAHPMLPLAPPCHQYGFTPGNFAFKFNGSTVSFYSNPPFDVGGPVAVYPPGDHGNVKGGMNGLNNVDFTIYWDAGAVGDYTGAVGNDGIVRGTVVRRDSLAQPVSWYSTTPLACIDAPPPPPPPIRLPESNTATLGPKPSLDPPAQTAGARLGVAVNGQTTLPAGLSVPYTVIVSNLGDAGAPVELYVSFGGNLQQAGQVTPSGGFNCEVINNAGGTTSVHCTAPQFQSKATNIVVQGRGSAPGAGHLTVNINSSDPGAQFVQKSQGLNVSIT